MCIVISCRENSVHISYRVTTSGWALRLKEAIDVHHEYVETLKYNFFCPVLVHSVKWYLCCKIHDTSLAFAMKCILQTLQCGTSRQRNEIRLKVRDKKNHTSGLPWTDRVDMTYLYGTLRTCYPDELGLHVLVRNGPIAWGSWFISVLNALYFRPPNVRHFSYCAPVSCNGFSIKLPTPYFPLLNL